MGPPKTNLNIPIILFLLVCPASLLGQEIKAIPGITVAVEGNFVLTVEDGRLSLQAQEASLKAILGDIGHKMGIEVVGKIPPQETVTAEFYNLSLENALQRLSPNYGYQVGSKNGDTNITKIFVLPMGTINGATQPTRQIMGAENSSDIQTAERQIKAKSATAKESDEENPPRTEPFKFEFDP